MLDYQIQDKEEEKVDLLEESRKLGDEWLNSDLKKKLEEERKKKEEAKKTAKGGQDKSQSSPST